MNLIILALCWCEMSKEGVIWWIWISAYPEMAYISQGNLRFLTRHVDKQEWKKPSKNILTVSIKLENVIKLYLMHWS